MRIDTHHHHKKAGENLAFVFFMNLAFNILVIVGGLATNSMAILADCIHDLSDTISIALAWALEKVAQKDSTEKYSYGYQRFSILGAVIISVFVIIMAFVILQEAIPRLFAPESVDARGMLLFCFRVCSLWLLYISISKRLLQCNRFLLRFAEQIHRRDDKSAVSQPKTVISI